MKINKMMRIASVLLVAVLLSTCAIFSTFAKYVTVAEGSDAARVARWGYKTNSLSFENLFVNSYDNVLSGTDDVAIIAPGTEGKVYFAFLLDNNITAPEVAYTFKVDTTGSSNATSSNTNIKWRLTQSAEAPTDWSDADTWDNLLADIQALDGTAGADSKDYAVGAKPDMVDKTYYVHWEWLFENSNDSADNTLGNTMDVNATKVVLTVTISATQKD